MREPPVVFADLDRFRFWKIAKSDTISHGVCYQCTILHDGRRVGGYSKDSIGQAVARAKQKLNRETRLKLVTD